MGTITHDDRNPESLEHCSNPSIIRKSAKGNCLKAVYYRVRLQIKYIVWQHNPTQLPVRKTEVSEYNLQDLLASHFSNVDFSPH